MWQTAVIGVLAGGARNGHRHRIRLHFGLFRRLDRRLIRGICQILTPIPVLLIQVVVAGIAR